MNRNIFQIKILLGDISSYTHSCNLFALKGQRINSRYRKQIEIMRLSVKILTLFS